MSNYRKNKRAAIEATDPLGDFSLSEKPTMNEMMDGMMGYAPPAPALPDNALVPVDGSQGAFAYKRFTITSTALDMPDDITEDEWLDVGQQLRYLDEAIQWNLGDLVMHVREHHNKDYRQIADALGYEEQTLRAYVYVSRHVDRDIRIAGLSHSHHRLVAGLRTKTDTPDTKAQRRWLEQAADNNWTLSQMREAMRADKAQPKKLSSGDAAHRKTFNRMWRRAETGKPVKQSDIEMLRNWLDKLETTAVD